LATSIRCQATRVGELRWSGIAAQKQDVYFLSQERKKQQIYAG